jgi:hypothetical protein
VTIPPDLSPQRLTKIGQLCSAIGADIACVLPVERQHLYRGPDQIARKLTAYTLHMSGMSYPEIGAVLKCSYTTARNYAEEVRRMI